MNTKELQTCPALSTIITSAPRPAQMRRTGDGMKKLFTMRAPGRVATVAGRNYLAMVPGLGAGGWSHSQSQDMTQITQNTLTSSPNQFGGVRFIHLQSLLHFPLQIRKNVSNKY